MKELVLEKLRVIGLSLFLLLLLGLAIAPNLFIPTEWWSGTVKQQFIAYFIVVVFILFIWKFISSKLERYDLVPFGRVGFSWKYLGYVLVSYLFMRGIDELGFFWLKVIGEGTTDNEELIAEGFSKLPDIITILSAVIVVPILEEVIFRGFLNRIMFRHWRFLGITVSSLLFASGHGPTDLPSWFIYAGSGFVSAYLYEMTDDLAYPMLLHILNNALAHFT